MLRGLCVLLLAVPMVAAKMDMDAQLASAVAEAKKEQSLLQSDVKHWQTEKEALEELLDGRDSISPKSAEKFQGELDFAKKQQELAEAALQVQTLQMEKMQTITKDTLEQGAHLWANPFFTPGSEGQQFPAFAQWPAMGAMPAADLSLATHPKEDGECTVWLKDQISGLNNRGDCIYNKTYGCHDKNHMWVDQGCRGTFECNGEHEKCESWSYKWEKCRCAKKEESLVANPTAAAGIMDAWKQVPGATEAIETLKKGVPLSPPGQEKLVSDQAMKLSEDLGNSVKAAQQMQSEFQKAQESLVNAGAELVKNTNNMNAQVANLLSKSKQLAQTEAQAEKDIKLMAKQEPAEAAEPIAAAPPAEDSQELVQCKVKCQRFGMKSMGPEFENLSTPQECVSKCDDVYGA